ncbi:MAG: hypothetical protein V7709_14585 [Halioglobus sp.]
MKPFSTRIITASALSAGASYASAHEVNTTATLYHYFSSPDHVAVFTLLAIAAVLTGLAVRGRHTKAIKLKKK